MAGLELFNKPDLEKRITFACKDAAGAVEHLLYKLDSGTKKMTVCGAGDIPHGAAVISAAQDVPVAFDTDGILVGVASGAIDIGGEVQTGAAGKVLAKAAGARIGYALSTAADGQKVAYRARF